MKLTKVCFEGARRSVNYRHISVLGAAFMHREIEFAEASLAFTDERGLTRAGASRLDGIDLLRGLVIILMVLDHARDYLHAQAFLFDAANPTQTTVPLFVTRWITHLCAPTFVFLAGVSIYLQRANGKDVQSLRRYLLARGCWLIALEFTIISFGFNFGGSFAFVQVIWAIGASMLLLAALIGLPSRAVLAVGVVIVAGHSLLPLVDAASLRPLLGAAVQLLFQPGPAIGYPGLVIYPLIPWFGIMCLGYGLGSVFLQPVHTRRRTLLTLGSAALLLFVVLRSMNGYGDPVPWSVYESTAKTALSFMNVSKYPPSFLYALVTLGCSVLLFLALEPLRGFARRMLLAFGRTPLFTYVLHIYIVHTLSMLIGVVGGLPASYFVDFLSDADKHAGAGFGLPVVYAAWATTIALLYPASKWFEGIKRRRREWWLSYV
jgi:uncharacterized membrane protein